MKRVLFICGKNRLRSPTAEQVFAAWPGIETASAGLSADADEVMSGELARWADLIFVMEKAQRARLSRRYGPDLKGTRIICLDIADRYAFMDPDLVALLKTRVTPHL
jgi:predicted protein tyrosine phosphatase